MRGADRVEGGAVVPAAREGVRARSRVCNLPRASLQAAGRAWSARAAACDADYARGGAVASAAGDGVGARSRMRSRPS